jgi:hypothetical protein
LDSVHIRRMGIHSLTVDRIRLYVTICDLARVNREQSGADRLGARGRGVLPLPAMLPSDKAEINPCFTPVTNNLNAAAERALHGQECQAGCPCIVSSGRGAAADRWQRATAIPDPNAASNGVRAPAPQR